MTDQSKNDEKSVKDSKSEKTTDPKNGKKDKPKNGVNVRVRRD